MERLKYIFIKKIYADHNESKTVKTVLKSLLHAMPSDGFGLNVGAGRTRLDSRIRNLEIVPGENVDYVGSADSIPLPDSSVDLLVTQEVLEHVESPWAAMKEMARVLKPNGKLYLQLPFIIGFHPCPKDFWRFTNEGIVQLAVDSGFLVTETGNTVGSATGFYRVAVEFFSIIISIPLPKLYRPLKACFSLLLYPIKWLDPIANMSPERFRISGGFYVVCEKRQ